MEPNEMETAFRSDESFTQGQFFDWVRSRPASDLHHYELLGGHIVMTPPAGFPHGAIEARIVAALMQHVASSALGMVFGSSAGFELPSGDTVEPDVSFVSTDDMSAGQRPVFGKFLRMVPTLVVEILSRSTARRDRGEKRKIYERNGVGEYWIASPESRQVIIYRRMDGGFSKPLHVVHGDVESSVLTGLRIPLATIFADCDAV